MKALQLQSFNGPDALVSVETAEPEAAEDSAIIEVRAIGINYPDLLMTKGLYQLKPDLPFVPGCEVAGVLTQVPRESSWKIGDRVATFVWTGGYASHVAAPVSALIPVEDDMDFSTAAALIINYHTVHFALTRRGNVKAGETLLVLGAGGGIGSAGVQVGKGLGLRVIGGVADAGQVDAAYEAGADEVIVLSEGFSAPLRELTEGRGIDVVIDPLGDWLFGESLRALAPEGRILIIGFAAGTIPQLSINRLLLKNISAIGVAWGSFLDIDPTLMSNASKQLSKMYSAGILKPLLGERFTFDQIPEALHRLSRGEIRGKGIVELPVPEEQELL
jgi:NADPH2:quinone reductase